ncbi:Crp/Fnr family transcriptional regulator [Candidatus Acetothermia bacterium]|jgi:CRP/FNR family transcriptional regulator|nr:Crp/Fnr family transcriptional regulator [Candidatus Acetothermia bacterium]MCI2431484.1 Crp/Fnr family transcriptional regulator [Candidatus Acetothermia bacterium]MCI2436446.1 Crp/Fnr family transcriptional regulator [Candidatus Acetothermia bacterium]
MQAELESRNFWCVLGINIFDALSPEDMRELSRYTKGRKYKRGEAIYLPGDPNTTVYFLMKGRVKLVYLDERGRKFTTAICRPGQPFGELVFSERREPYRFIAQALEDSELCLIPKDELVRFAQERPQLALRLTKWVGDQFRELQIKLEDLLFKDVPTRLARLLERLAHEEGQKTPQGIEIALKLTHQELAELIGSTRETTTLLLNQLRRAGVIGRRRGRLVINDLQRLQTITTRS